METVIADTGFIVALTNSNDSRHAEVRPVYTQQQRILLPQTVLVEVAYLLGRDAGIAIAERLNITTVLTIDQRDFRLFRPKHCESFKLLP
jgi:uncharacterized protein